MEYPLPENCISCISNVMNQNNVKDYRKAIRKPPDEDDPTLLFLKSQFLAIYAFHTTYQDVYDRDVTFNDLFLFPLFREIRVAVSTELESVNIDLCKNEVYLESVSTQLRLLNMLTGNRHQYKADGLIKIFGYKKLKVALLKYLSQFGSTGQSKSKNSTDIRVLQ